MINAEQIRELFRYNPETGVIVNRVARGTRAQVGAIAGHVDSLGYRHIVIEGKRYAAHRLIWLYCHGQWPKEQIDHIDGDPSNNKLENLREATNSQNSRNRKIASNNASGITGIHWRKHQRKWHAKIKVHGKCKHLGYFDDLGEAALARKAAEEKYGFHENHGRAQ